MRNAIIIAGVAALLIGGGAVINALAAPTFTVVQPVPVPGTSTSMTAARRITNPSGLLPLEVTVNDRGRPVKDFDVVLTYRPTANGTATQMPHSAVSVAGSKVTATAVHPFANAGGFRYNYNNANMVDFTWTGTYTNFFGMEQTFEKTATVRFPVLIMQIVGTPLRSRGTATMRVTMSPIFDAPVTVDLSSSPTTSPLTLSSPSVTIPALQQSATVNVTAPLVRCPETPVIVLDPTLCVLGRMAFAGAKFGTNSYVTGTNQCIRIDCEP